MATVPAAIAVAEISAALNEIEPATLLFLQEHRARAHPRRSGRRTRSLSAQRSAARRSESPRHAGEAASGRADEEWFVWHRQLGDLGHPALRVEIAFLAGTANGERRLVKRDDSPLVVFFPTQKETFLGFLIQGPYRTTPARDNVPEHDPSNQALVRETAALLADVLTELRDDGLLTVDVLQALPLDPARFQPGTMFRPLFDSVRDGAGRASELIPVAGGGYGAAGELKLARGAGLRELLPRISSARSTEPASRSPSRMSPSPKTGRPLLWRYLREEIGIDEVTPEAVAGRSPANSSWRSQMRGSGASTRSSIAAPRCGGSRAPGSSSPARRGQGRSSGSKMAAT